MQQYLNLNLLFSLFLLFNSKRDRSNLYIIEFSLQKSTRKKLKQNLIFSSTKSAQRDFSIYIDNNAIRLNKSKKIKVLERSKIKAKKTTIKLLLFLLTIFESKSVSIYRDKRIKSYLRIPEIESRFVDKQYLYLRMLLLLCEQNNYSSIAQIEERLHKTKFSQFIKIQIYNVKKIITKYKIKKDTLGFKKKKFIITDKHKITIVFYYSKDS